MKRKIGRLINGVGRRGRRPVTQGMGVGLQLAWQRRGLVQVTEREKLGLSLAQWDETYTQLTKKGRSGRPINKEGTEWTFG